MGFNKFTSPYIEYGTGNQVVVPVGWEDFAMQFKKGDGVNIKPMPYFHPAINSELENLKRKLNNSMKP